jgi:predicted amidohydrolase
MDEFLHENSRKSHETIDIIYDDIRHTVHLLQSDISHNDFITTRKQRDNPIRVMHWNHILTNSFSFAFDFKALPESAWTNFHSKNRETPKICVCSFESAGVEFEIDRGETDVSFLAKDIHPSVDRFAEAEKVLHYAVENDCDIVIFPELTIPNNIVDEIACWLNTNRNRENSKGHGISLVIAGSFHKYNRKKDAYFNTCTALDHTGSIAFTHDKMTRFTGDEKYGVEKTSTGRSLAIIELPFGRGVTLICKDFCDDNMRMHDFAHQSGVDYFFVPTMGGESTMKLHETRVKAIYRMAGPVVALVNQELGDPTDNGASSIYHGFLRGEIGKKSTISRLGYESFGKDVT